MSKPETSQPLVAAFEVRINGSPLALADAAHVDRLTIEQDVGLPGMFAVHLIGTDDLDEELPWIDDTGLFSIGNAVELRLGYEGDLETVMVGEITGLEPEFHLGQLPNLTVRGFDRLHRLQRGRRTRTFLQQKDSDVASQIANEAGLTPDVEDSGVTHEYLVQANQTDLDFLRQRAARIHYELGVDDKTLTFRPVQNGEEAAVTLTMGDSLVEFHPRLSALGQAGEVSVRGWSAKDKKEIVGQARAGDETSTMGGEATGAASADGAFGSAVLTVSAWPTATQAEADQAAKARFNDVGLRFVAGEGVCPGRTDLRTGGVVGIEGVGRRFTGRYYITAVSHRYASGQGYETRFSVRRNAS